MKYAKGEIGRYWNRSGSGKSTLLRIAAGLIPATFGTKFIFMARRLNVLHKALRWFSTFCINALVNCASNVELGLEAIGVPRQERRTRALKAIDMIGLDGFGSAFLKSYQAVCVSVLESRERW